MVAHHQTNGQIEVTNRIFLRRIEKRLEESKGKWTKELLSVLRTYRTTSRFSTRVDKMAYDTKVIVLIEIGSPSFIIEHFNEAAYTEGILLNLDLLNEATDKVVLKIAKYQQKIGKHFNQKGKPRVF